MKYLQKIGSIGYISVALLFFVCGFALIVLAGMGGRVGTAAIRRAIDTRPVQADPRMPGLADDYRYRPRTGPDRAGGRSAASRACQLAAPAAAFPVALMIVVGVSLGVEYLVRVFQFLHNEPELLPQVASIGVAAAVLLASWGVFVRMEVEAEKVEPQAMREAHAEDQHVET